jgi:diguanylate cyclase (GGDEF)-like protein/PAS domain S-box-containing protein
MNAGRASKGLGRMASHLPWVAAGLAAIYACVLLWSLFSSQTLLREAHHDHLLADGQRRAEVVAEFLAERRQSVVSLAAEREIGDYLANEALGMSERYGLNISLDAIERRLAEYLAQHTRGGRPVFDGIAFFGRDGGLIVGAGESLASGAPTVHGREVLVHIADDGADYRVQAPVVFRGDHQGMLVATGALTALATTLIAHPGERGGAPSYIELIIGRDGSVLMPAGQRAPLPSALGSALEQLPERAVRPLERVQLSAAPARDLLAVRLPVSGTGLSVATLVEPDVLYGQTVSSGYIQALAVLPLVMIALALVFARQRRRSRHLHAQVRAVEGQRAQLAVDNEALAAEVARRQAAESRLQQQAEALVRSNAELEQLALVFSHSREGISLNAGDGTILEVNDAFCRMTGYTREELVGQNPRILKSGRQSAEYYAAMWRTLVEEGQWSGEVWNRRKNGELYAELLTVSAVRDAHGAVRRYVAMFTDITAQKVHQRELEKLAHYDPLTGLPNRSLLADRLLQSMLRATRQGSWLAIVYLDLDGFKAINDHHGHDAGDRLLTVLATRMKHVLREGDTLARIGGDEFVAVFGDLTNIQSCEPMLARLLEAAAEEIRIDDVPMRVSASLGVTFFPQVEAIDPDQLLRQADQAMYQAKLLGKNRYHLFDADQDRALRGRHEGLDRIRRALEAREFVLYYQPKVNMRSGRVLGVEALIRWLHPQRGLLSPAEFLPLVENDVLAVEIGDWVLDSALAQLARWHADGLALQVGVNVGARELQQVDFVERLRLRLERYPALPSGRLELEVLESSALDDIGQVSQVMEACRRLGVLFALDDFGTGYSSLTYLRRLPAATLKIDRSFVRDMRDDPEDRAILEGILGLAGAFRRRVVAEGVETDDHGELLLDLGCELAQGYGIARPMPASELPAWVARWTPPPAWLDRPRCAHDPLTSGAAMG